MFFHRHIQEGDLLSIFFHHKLDLLLDVIKVLQKVWREDWGYGQMTNVSFTRYLRQSFGLRGDDLSAISLKMLHIDVGYDGGDRRSHDCILNVLKKLLFLLETGGP